MRDVVDPRMTPDVGIPVQRVAAHHPDTRSFDANDDDVELDRLDRREQLLHALEITRRRRRRRSQTRYA